MHAIQHQANDPSRLAPTRGESARLAFAFGFAALVAIPLSTLAISAPKFMEVFRDFGVVMPMVLVRLLEAGIALSNPVWIVTTTITAMLTGWLIQPMLRDRWWKLVLWWVLIGGALAIAMLAYAAMLAITLETMRQALEDAA